MRLLSDQFVTTLLGLQILWVLTVGSARWGAPTCSRSARRSWRRCGPGCSQSWTRRWNVKVRHYQIQHGLKRLVLLFSSSWEFNKIGSHSKNPQKRSCSSSLSPGATASSWRTRHRRRTTTGWPARSCRGLACTARARWTLRSGRDRGLCEAARKEMAVATVMGWLWVQVIHWNWGGLKFPSG